MYTNTFALVIVLVLSLVSGEKAGNILKKTRDVGNLQVTTVNGVVQGRTLITSGKNKSYYAFSGIPYAQKPIGERRFLPPQPASSWTGVYDATYERDICYQFPFQGSSTANMSEDCLYLNVYTPRFPSPNKKLLSVMVWIYGGGFLSGNSNYHSYGPDYLIEQNVLILTLNYRLGAFGFLSTEDMVLPGNNGIKDQIFALRWVQANIAAFGGNPNDVTIFGESAGAASVSYIVQSYLATGLYQRAIMQSGSSLCLWALSRKAREHAFLLGTLTGIVTTDSADLVRHLRTVDASVLNDKSLISSGTLLAENIALDGLILAPVREPPHSGAVFTYKSYELLNNGLFNRVPILLGFNSEEGNGLSDLIQIMRFYLLKFDLLPITLVPIDLNINNLIVKSFVGEAIKRHYAPGLLDTFVLDDYKFIHFFSDDVFVRPIREDARLSSRYATTYLYEFTYVGDLGNPDRTDQFGVGHTEDVNYIFKTPTEPAVVEPSDKLTRDRIIKMWTNFAKYGNPTPIPDPLLENVVWNVASTTANLTYLDIGTDLVSRTNPHSWDMDFWDFIYTTFGNPPYDTY